MKPIERSLSLVWPDATVTPGRVTILPRKDSQVHPVHGHFFVGDEAHPYTGQVTMDVPFTPPQPAPRGRPPSTRERDVGILLACTALERFGVRLADSTTQPERAAKRLALDWWRGTGITDIRHITRAMNKAARHIGPRGFEISYSGTEEGQAGTGMQVALYLPGAVIEADAGEMKATGPAWYWRHPDKQATYCNSVTTSFKSEKIKPFQHTV